MTSEQKRWVIVAGAGGALGAALTTHLLGAGRRVLALDRDGDALARLPANPMLHTAAADLTEPDAVEAALGAIARGEPIDLLVNAVGFIANEPLVALKGAKLRRHDVGVWRTILDANLTAVFVMCAAAAERMMRSGGGVIVNFSSVAARGNPGQAAYSAAKAGVEGLTRALAQELGPYGIRVNAVAPGFIDVATTRNALSEAQVETKVARTPLGRMGSTADIAAAVDAIEANGFMTGVVLPVDGGVQL
jgi:3-oxoacyl-[acyl-carrier protein] reductase